MSPTIALLALALNVVALAACVWIIISLSDRRYPVDPTAPHRPVSRRRTRVVRL